MAMILPERTVDAWTASYITGRRWRARLWAPTERRPGERYDLGVGVGSVAGVPVPPHSETWPDKVFVFEHKGVDEGLGGVPIIWIRIRQLLDHLLEDRRRGGGLVYYLLPDPTWSSSHPAPYGSVPDVAWRRTPGPKLPSGGRAWEGFQRWASVAHVEDLLRLIGRVHRVEPKRFKGRAASGGRAADWVCSLDMAEVRGLRGRVSLLEFISGVRRCTQGRLVGDKSLRNPRPGPTSYASRLTASPDTLAAALSDAEGEEEATAGHRDEQEGLEVPDEPDAERLAEIFERPAFTTVYGIGDSEQDPERPQSSFL